MIEYNEKRIDVDNIFQSNTKPLFEGNSTNDVNLVEQNEYDAMSYLNQIAYSPNCPPNVLVPLSIIKTLMNSHTAMAAPEVFELAPNTNHKQNSYQNQMTDSSTSQDLNAPQLPTVPNIFGSKSKMQENFSQILARNTHTEVKKVREVNKSMTIDKDKDLLKNISRKRLSRVNYRSRNKHNSTNNNSEKDKSSRYDPQSHNAVEACQVCGDIASTHVHYGGRSCQSCRAFFRRSVVKFSK